MLNNIKEPLIQIDPKELLNAYDQLILKLSTLNIHSSNSEINTAFLFIYQELPNIFCLEKKLIKASSHENSEIYLQEHDYFLTKKLQIQHQINTKAPQQLILFSFMRFVDKLKQHSQSINCLFQF